MKRLLIAGMMPACVLGVVWFLAQPTSARMGKASNQSEGPDRSPIALALSKDGTRLLSANQTAGTISWVDVKAGQVLAEIAVGDKPAGVALAGDRKRGVVTNWFGYDLAVLDLSDDQPKVVGKVEVGPEPRGVVLSADGSTAYVAVGASNEVVRVDCEVRKVTGRVTVGREPRGIALSPDGSRLLVGNVRGKSLTVVSVKDWSVERTLPIDGDNLRQLLISPDGQTGYVVDMTNRGFAITNNNIDLGWVLGQRVLKSIARRNKALRDAFSRSARTGDRRRLRGRIERRRSVSGGVLRRHA